MHYPAVLRAEKTIPALAPEWKQKYYSIFPGRFQCFFRFLPDFFAARRAEAGAGRWVNARCIGRRDRQHFPGALPQRLAIGREGAHFPDVRARCQAVLDAQAIQVRGSRARGARGHCPPRGHKKARFFFRAVGLSNILYSQRKEKSSEFFFRREPAKGTHR